MEEFKQTPKVKISYKWVEQYLLPIGILVILLAVSSKWLSLTSGPVNGNKLPTPTPSVQAVVQPTANLDITLPAKWGDLGIKLVKAGVIDETKLKALYKDSPQLAEIERLLSQSDNNQIVMTSQNAGIWLNLFWALGLANKNEILTKGPMMDKQYGNPANFASTGGWTLAAGSVMSHYAMHNMIMMTEDEQKMVEDMAKGIYRPCCNNPTYFPDCNHGMAMLGLLELMASQGASQADMYKVALAANRFWFPSNYATVDRYLQSKNLTDVDPKSILGSEYSSGSGYKNIASQVTPASGGGSSCGL